MEKEKEKKVSLFELDTTIEQILENGFAYDEETGEITFTSDDLEKLQGDLDTKIENIGLYIKNEESMASLIKAEEKSLKSRRESHEKKVESLEKYLGYFMQLTGKDSKPFETSRVKISFRKSTASDIYDEEALRAYITSKDEYKEKYFKYGEPTISKTELTNSLKENDKLVIPGFRLVENKNIQVK